MAAQSATLPSGATAGARSAAMADAPNEPPTPMSNVPMASEPTDSNLP